MASNPSVPNDGVCSDAQIRNVLRRHIRKALDRREFSRETLSAESGVNVHTIDAILSSDPGKHRRVATEDAFNLVYMLGDAAVEALVGCLHYSARRADAAEENAPGVIVATVLAYTSKIADAAADGRFDHTERPSCQEAADRIIATLAPLSSAGKAA